MNEKFYKALKIFTAVFGIIVWILLILPERWSLTAESEMRIMSCDYRHLLCQGEKTLGG